MRANLAKYASGVLLLGALAPAPAQSIWNYFISDAGGGNSLLTWGVTGDLAGSSGAAWTIPGTKTGTMVTVAINAPGLFVDSYVANGTPQNIPTVDGSYFQLEQSQVYLPILSYQAYNAPGTGNDSFGLSAPLNFGQAGILLLYHPGTQAALIPIDFSDFNPGTYQSEQSGFSTAVTVNLTVGPVPEPSLPALLVLGGLSGLLGFRRSRLRLPN
jgi:hypothetical protein